MVDEDPDNEQDRAPPDLPDADQIEEDWGRALDSAEEALGASRRGGTLGPDDIAASQKHIQEERSWLAGIRPTLRKLLPRRDQGTSGSE